ncbi:hypothetical protein MKW94_012644 [Papaver nudicaule]|uniref:RIN4 pathogenic type III effector avirulence factor Avr cleavage site domain-containing protein n=1 Tax=Papaver nudicaule TaxID=74823 RepID=A0AA41RWY1_PAPNU|nr:hypothetical protein [Papaver nudicaule]
MAVTRSHLTLHYFETARIEKGAAVKGINPNDPEENPYAFFGRMGHEHDRYYNAKPIARNGSGRKAIEAEKSNEDYQERDHLKSRDRKSIRSESSSQKSNSDFSLVQQKIKSSRSIEQESLGEFSGLPPMSPPPNRIRSEMSMPNEARHHKTASVPKFGAWDETDPKSGEGFTIIFNKVKEETQIGANFPTIRPPPTNYSKESSSKAPKRCCCLF